MSVFGNPSTVTKAQTFGISSSLGVTAPTALGDLIVVGFSSNLAPTGVADLIAGNTYTQAFVFIDPINSFRISIYYCLSSAGANASNVVTASCGSTAEITMSVTNVPVSNATVTLDVAGKQGSDSGSSLTVTSASFNTGGTDEILFAACNDSHNSGTIFTPQSNYTLAATGPYSGQAASINLGVEFQTFTSTQTGITSSLTTTSALNLWSAIGVAGFKGVSNGYNVSGNIVDQNSAALSGVTVSWTGTASGSTTTDGSGNWTAPTLVNGTYTFTPTKTGYGFTPKSTNETVAGVAITGVNFTGSNAYSQPDCRVVKPNMATSEIINNTALYDKQTSSNPAIAPVDSRVSKPTASGTYPQNSRNPARYTS